MMNKNFVTGKRGFVYLTRRSIQKLFGRVIPNELMSRFYYRLVLKKKLDLKNPKTFNEKLQWYKLVYCPNNPLVIQCSDKYKVRQYVIERGLGQYLVPLLGVWNNPDEIEWNTLPEQFVLKGNHGCAYNIICRDKETLDVSLMIKYMKCWLKEDFGLFNIEPHYDYIDKKIICEEYIQTRDGSMPDDIKIYFFSGVPKLILVATEREKKLKLTFFDTGWNMLNIGKHENASGIEKPKLLDEAIEIATKLAGDFPFVRVDLYDCNNQIILGELSFTPAAGIAAYYTEEGDRIVGDMFDLPKTFYK